MNTPSPKGFRPAQEIKPSNVRLEILKRPAKGSKKSVSLLFVPGGYHSASAFDHFMAHFSDRGFDCTAVSLRGHGKSDGRDTLNLASFDDFLSDVRQAISTISGPVVILGHSMGGMLLQKHLESETPAGVVLMCVSAKDDFVRSTLGVLKQYPLKTLRALLTNNTDILFRNREICRNLFFHGDRSPGAEKCLDHMLNQPESSRAIKECMAFRPGTPIRPTPVLMIGGEVDLNISHTSLENRAKNYHGELKYYKGMPHELFVTPGWETVAQDIIEWLDRKVILAAAS